MAAVLAGPPAVAQPGAGIAGQMARDVAGPRGAGNLPVRGAPGICRCAASWSGNPAWVSMTARNAATPSCLHESPARAKTAHPAAGSMTVIFQM